MKIIGGSEKQFFDFLDKLNKKDKIAILSHNDLDGVVSGIILNEILKNKGLKPKIIKFMNCTGGIFSNVINELKKKRINKILVSDLAIDVDYEGYKKLENEFDSFSIDHHPFENLNEVTMLKTRSEDCASFSLFQLAKKYFPEKNIGSKKLIELICATMIVEFSHKDEENLKFIRRFYPDIMPETAYSNSKPGEICKKISSALIYFERKEKKIFNILVKSNISKLNKYTAIVEKEVEKYTQLFRNEQEFFEDKKIHFYYKTPKLKISSVVSTILSLEKPNETFIFAYDMSDKPGFVKVSARNQNGKMDMNVLMKKGVEGIEKGVGGGHPKAAGGDFLKKDLDKFKQNILK